MEASFQMEGGLVFLIQTAIENISQGVIKKMWGKTMKKTILIMLLLLASMAVVFATDGGERLNEDVRRFQLQNTFIGFGTGSRHQGDLQSARTLLGLDITGTTLTVSGGLGLAGSILMHGMIKAYIGDVTKADIYISAGVLSAGIITLIVSKALGISYPLSF